MQILSLTTLLISLKLQIQYVSSKTEMYVINHSKIH